MLASMATFAIEGVDSQEVTVEVDVRRGLPGFTLVGLPDAAVREARERVRAAVINSGFEFPQQRLTANLAPADIRKAGPSFDLALAIALLAAQRTDRDRRALPVGGGRRALAERIAQARARSGGDGGRCKGRWLRASDRPNGE